MALSDDYQDTTTNDTDSNQVQDIGVLKRRTINRLLGTLVLVVLALIGLPLLFDTQPRPINVGIDIEIPQQPAVQQNTITPQNSTPQNSAGQSQTQAAVAPNAATPSVAALPPVEPATRAVSNAAGAAPNATVPLAPIAPLPSVKVENKKTEQNVALNEEKAKIEKEKQLKAQKAEKDKADKLAKEKASGNAVVVPNVNTTDETIGKRYVIQVGSYEDSLIAQADRQKVERTGLKTYVQVVQTTHGERTRVRVGPFTSKEQAQAAEKKISGTGLPAKVLELE